MRQDASLQEDRMLPLKEHGKGWYNRTRLNALNGSITVPNRYRSYRLLSRLVAKPQAFLRWSHDQKLRGFVALCSLLGPTGLAFGCSHLSS